MFAFAEDGLALLVKKESPPKSSSSSSSNKDRVFFRGADLVTAAFSGCGVS